MIPSLPKYPGRRTELPSGQRCVDGALLQQPSLSASRKAAGCCLVRRRLAVQWIISVRHMTPTNNNGLTLRLVSPNIGKRCKGRGVERAHGIFVVAWCMACGLGSCRGVHTAMKKHSILLMLSSEALADIVTPIASLNQRLRAGEWVIERTICKLLHLASHQLKY